MAMSDTKQIDDILENLYFLLEGGLSLPESLDILGNKIKGLNHKVGLIRNALIQGQTFCEALSLAFNQKIPHLFMIFIKIGEGCGNLGPMLKKALETRGELKRIKSSFLGALSYPIFICSIAFIMMFGIMLFIMPKLTPIFRDLHVVLPIYTRAFITISNVSVKYGIFIFSFFLCMVFLFIYLVKKSEKLKFEIEKIISQSWGIKNLFIYYHTSTIAICTSQYLRAGYSFYESWRLISESINSKIYKEACLNIALDIQNGKHISAAIQSREYLFPNWSYVLDIASQSGRLSEQFERFYLENMAYIEKISVHVKRWSEPILMLFIGGMIAMFAVSIISPIYSIVQNVAI